MHDSRPVEAALGEARDGARAGLLDHAEVDELIQALRLGGGLVELLLETRLLSLAVVDLLTGERDRDDAEKEQHQPARQHIDEAARPKRGIIAPALVGGNEVDRAHQLPIASP